MSTPSFDSDYLTVADIARVLRLSKMTVYRMLEDGEMSYVRVGRCYRVPIIAFRDYLAVNTTNAFLR